MAVEVRFNPSLHWDVSLVSGVTSAAPAWFVEVF
jgi:hypothetical protein